MHRYQTKHRILSLLLVFSLLIMTTVLVFPTPVSAADVVWDCPGFPRILDDIFEPQYCSGDIVPPLPEVKTLILGAKKTEGTEITLVTGDVVIATRPPDGHYTFTVRPADPTKGVYFQTLDTPEGSYVIPNHADLEKLDMELFNIKYLIEEGYHLLPSLPIIIGIEEEEPAEMVESIKTMVEDAGAKVIMGSPKLGMLAAELPFNTINHSSQNLVARPDVERIWLDRKVHIELNESVPLIGAPECWGAGYDGAGVKIAILDTGIDATHPDLDDLDDNPSTTDPKVIVAEDFTSDGFTEDLYGHGTHCASIAAGTGEASGYLYKGVAPGANLFNIKVLNAQGSGYDSWIINGIEYATLGPDGVADTGDEADILSMSFGADWNGDGTDPQSLAIDWATDQGVICVVAAGNIGPQMFTVGTPAVAQKAITVGASTKAGAMADFSSRGPSADLRLKPDVVAPGVGIIAARAVGTSMGSPIDDFYTGASGTSMATPHVAGAAALILQVNPAWEPTMVKSALMGYARVIEDTHLWDQGGGRIQVPQAAAASLLAIEPSLSFGRLEVGEVKSATVALMNLGDAPASVNITAYTICEGVEANYVSVTPGSMEIPAGESRDISVEVGPLDEEAPEGWYEGWVIISRNDETLRVPYIFSTFSTISVTLYDVDDTTEIEGMIILATYPDMEFVAFGWDPSFQFRVKSGEYALMASYGLIEDDFSRDFSRMFMIQKIITVPKLSAVDISLSLADARVSEIPTVNSNGEDLTVHCYVQYFSGDPYYNEDVGKTTMNWSMGACWFGMDIAVPALTFYSSEYASADKMSEAFGYYASENLLCEAYLPSNIYLLNWKYYNITLIPSTITYDPSDLARYNFFYDMPETYPENGLNIMNAFWFTPEYLADNQLWVSDTHQVLAGMNATYYLAPDIATYWGYYSLIYGGWDYYLFGPVQEWSVGQNDPYPQNPPGAGETGNITLGEFQFAPYVPGLTLQVMPGGGSTKVDLSGEIWTGLSWPHRQFLIDISPYPQSRIPHYEFYVDGNEVAAGSLGRPDGNPWYEGLWWDDISESWSVTGGKGLLRVHMPTLGTISNWTTYELDFDLSTVVDIPPLFNSIVVPPGYSPGETITIELQTPDNITSLTLEYSFDKGTTWQVAGETGEGYLIPTEMADELSIRISGIDANGNSVMYVSHAISLSGEVKLEAPQNISGIPGLTIEIPGSLTTIEGEGLKGLAVSMSDGEILNYTSPDEEGAFAFAYEVNELPQELVITSPTAGVYDSATTTATINPASAIENDIFTETVAQLLMELHLSPGIVTPSPDLPPTDGGYRSPQAIYAVYTGAERSIVLQDTLHRPLTEPAPVITNVGPDEHQSFQSLLLTNVVVTPLFSEPVQVEFAGWVQTIAQGKAGHTVGSFDAEIVSMHLQGEIPGVESSEIRESITLASGGHTDITDIGGGLYRIESFFDVFTELSVDGGVTWMPSTDSVRVELVELQLVPLVGPVEVQVFFEGPNEGDAVDDDGNGLDEVRTEIMNMDLKGITPVGPIQVGVRTDRPTEGEIEELVNNTSGQLDLDPFHPGDASSFFDAWPKITMGGQVFFTAAPLRLETTIYHKPPQDGERYINQLLTWVELIDPLTSEGTGNFVVCGIHQPDPTTEVDQFSQTSGLVELVGGPIGAAPTAFSLQGDAEVHVYFEGPTDGDAVDDDWTALDEVVQQLVSMNLVGGGVTLRIRDITKSPFGPSLGQIEELVNNTPGRLDLDPFHPGDADSFFDVLFEIELPDGTILHNEQPVRIQAVISEKPWNTCFHFILPPESPVALYDEANQPTEVNLVQGRVFCPGGTITVNDVTMNEDAGVADFTVTLSNPSSFPVTVNYSTADGTATAGSDYTAASGTLTFPAGETDETISVPIVDDFLYEGDETFYLNLENPVNATISDGQGIGTILDNDLEPTLSINDVTMSEDGGGANFTVSLSSPSSFPVTVNYSTADGTATAGSDYTAASGTLTFPAGETDETISVPIVDDFLYEGVETFSLNLTNPANATISDGQGMGTILDNDPEPTLSINDMTVSEDVGGADFTVTLSNPSSFPVTVNYSTADGTATAGSDYTAASGTLTFPAGETAKTISVPIVDDFLYEGVETFSLNLTNPANATISDGQGMGTILDNDLPPELMVEALIDDVIDTPDLPEATKTGLIASLNAALKVLEDSNQKNDVAAINILEAFIIKVEAQRNKKIPEEVADELIAKAQDIIAVLSLGT